MGVAFQFGVNKIVIFNRRELKGSHQQLIRHLAIVFINYVLTFTSVFIAVELFGSPPYVGVVFSTGVTFIVGYLLSKEWVFREVL